MKNKYSEYINEYFYGALFLIVLALITLFTGYGYSPATGLTKGSRWFCLFGFTLAGISLLMDVIYVHLKRRYDRRRK